MAKQKYYEDDYEDIEAEPKKKAKKRSSGGVDFAGAKSMASSVLWISLVVCVLNIGVIILNIVGKNYWQDIKIVGDVTITVPPWWYLFQPLIGGISLFLLCGTSVLVIPLNKTLKREQARTFGTWFWGLIIWIFSVFYIVMFFFNIVAPILNLLIAIKVIGISPLDQNAIYICNTVMGCIPFVTILAAGLLYGCVKRSYRRNHGQ